jgi:hypothetical protein
MNFGAFAGKGSRYGKPNAIRARRHQHPQSLDIEVHAISRR